MTDKKKRVRTKEVGFVGVNLSVGGDTKLYDRLMKERKETTMSQSLIIRLALLDYFGKKDNKGD